MAKSNHKLNPANAFRSAVQATPHISNCYAVGLQAMGNYSTMIQPIPTRLCEGSVDIDNCTIGLFPNDSRWDYAIAFDSKVYFIEVHPASSSEVSTVLNKFGWLKNWLSNHAPELKRMSANSSFFWIPTGKHGILRNSPQARNLATSGIQVVSKLKLPR
jgi:hypothetical protein